MSSNSASTIRVFPSFPETAFFSGEEFTCTLTFKNVAEPSSPTVAAAVLPASPLEPGVSSAGRLVRSKLGGEWMADSGRSASEGGMSVSGITAPRRTPSSHERTMSTIQRARQNRSTSPGTRQVHGRSQSVQVASAAPKSTNFTKPAPPAPQDPQTQEKDSKNGVSPLKIDTTVEQPEPKTVVVVSPVDLQSPSPLPQISKLDLHSTTEDDASSETSSTGPSKPPLDAQNNTFNNFSPRSSLDIRDREREILPVLSRGQNQTRRLPRSPLSRTSDLGPNAEILLMGYAQITGNFVIDEALINPAEFDEVKGRGVMGGKSAGGVIGVDVRRSASWTGLGGLGTFGFGNFFGVGQPSSLAEMRDRASSKAVPILSTPPSILFVDIRLLPGESRSFSYAFKLPRDLPPSHRGRALRISYSLVITTQRPGKSGQHLSTAEIPFRLFSHIDDYGQQPKYDLKSPVILLRDEARTLSLADGEVPPTFPSTKPRLTLRRLSTYSDKPIESSQEEFMAFVDELLGSLGNTPLSATGQSPHLTVLPNATPTPTREQAFKPMTCREAVDIILRRGIGTLPGTKAKIGVFEIGKHGIPVAKLTLPRTTFKLGEIVEGIIDLEGGGNVHCYQIRSALESAEDVDPAVSVRSQSSIHRATRRVHSSKVEFTSFARRVHFAFEIPTGVAPSFETSSIRHHWSIRLEFITSSIPEPAGGEETQPIPQPSTQNLLQLVDKDDRASTYIAPDTLYCESFDCHVPVTILPTNQEIPEDGVVLTGFAV